MFTKNMSCNTRNILIAGFASTWLTSAVVAGPHHADPHHGGHAQPGTSQHWNAPTNASQQRNPLQATHQSLAAGAALYKKHCTSCHGDKGKGDGPAAKGLSTAPSDLATMAPTHPDGDLAWKISNGRGSMPAWKGILTTKQIWQLVNYLKSLGPGGKRPGGDKKSHGHSTDKHGHEKDTHHSH